MFENVREGDRVVKVIGHNEERRRCQFGRVTKVGTRRFQVNNTLAGQWFDKADGRAVVRKASNSLVIRPAVGEYLELAEKAAAKEAELRQEEAERNAKRLTTAFGAATTVLGQDEDTLVAVFGEDELVRMAEKIREWRKES